MPGLDPGALPNDLRPTGAWTAALLRALARDERAGRRPQRLTEPRLDTWSRFRGRLSSSDLIALLFEDAAVIHRVPFDPSAIGNELAPDRLPDPVAEAWVKEVQKADSKTSGPDYIADQAKLLGISTRLARSDLHVVKPHQRVLELPGTGGQLAYHLVSSQTDLTLQDNFVVACGSWQELTLAGVIALELGAPHSGFAQRVSLEDLRSSDHPIRQRTFDFVIGLSREKGGQFQAEDQLAIWFPNAKVLLV